MLVLIRDAHSKECDASRMLNLDLLHLVSVDVDPEQTSTPVRQVPPRSLVIRVERCRVRPVRGRPSQLYQAVLMTQKRLRVLGLDVNVRVVHTESLPLFQCTY